MEPADVPERLAQLATSWVTGPAREAQSNPVADAIDGSIRWPDGVTPTSLDLETALQRVEAKLNRVPSCALGEMVAGLFNYHLGYITRGREEESKP